MLKTVALLSLLLASTAEAQPRPAGGSAMLQQLVDCGKAADDAAQLACYRRAADALVRAEAEGAVVIVDREEARTVRRQAFGLSLPSLSLFDKGESEEELSTLVGQARAVRQDSTGRWIVQLDSGATWTQVEATPLRTTPKVGMRVTVTKAALGSYMMKIGDQHAVRARRVE